MVTQSNRVRMPRLPKPPTFQKGPKSVLPALLKPKSDWPEPPPGLMATKPEWLMYWALTKLGLTPDEDFTFQSSRMGPRYVAGSAIVDFLIVSRLPQLVIRVQGEFWHYQQGSERKAVDDIQRQELEGSGLRVVDVDEDDILRDPIYYANLALKEIDVSKAAKGRMA
jgi:very-short-patch-repair endonuclease